MRKIAIIGSCVSRDILNIENSNKYFLPCEYIPRSSLASWFSSQPFDDNYTEKLQSDFQRRVVRTDILKQQIKKLTDANADIILIDLIDERFDLIKTDSGLCTLSDELRSTGVLRNLQCNTIRSGSNEFISLWIEGWKKMLHFFINKQNIKNVYLNKVYWANQTKSGENFISTKERIESQNRFLDKLYDVIKAYLPERQIIEFNRDIFIGADEHRWGKSPFHYVESYYATAFEELKRRCL